MAAEPESRGAGSVDAPAPDLPLELAPGNGAVIWITGYSGSGKTTVARKVHSALRQENVASVLLDGDDLRGIFGNKWGYERENRLELAHAYFRLSNTLAAQGLTVVISAVAMYADVANWIRTHVDRSLQVYLKVPEAEREARDRTTKQLHNSIGDVSKMYDEPMDADLVIENYGAISAADATESILAAFRTREAGSADQGRERRWQQYYSDSRTVDEPSDYARGVAGQLPTGSALLEIGCGNGRDAVFFSSLGHEVTALDPSSAAIETCRDKPEASGILFLNGTVKDVRGARKFDVAYSRFCLHAMTEREEFETVAATHRLLKKGGSFFIECRSINDPLARKGEVISATERIFGHYRRFIVRDDLHLRLEKAGFRIVRSEELDNVAVQGEDNPVVIRVQAEKSE